MTTLKLKCTVHVGHFSEIQVAMLLILHCTRGFSGEFINEAGNQAVTDWKYLSDEPEKCLLYFAISKSSSEIIAYIAFGS